MDMKELLVHEIEVYTDSKHSFSNGAFVFKDSMNLEILRLDQNSFSSIFSISYELIKTILDLMAILRLEGSYE